MIDPRICPACGERAERPRLAANDTSGPGLDAPGLDGRGPDGRGPEGIDRLACPTCGATWPFRRLPLFCLTGPSGAGKSTVAALVGPLLQDRVVTLEQDVLWQPKLADQPGGIRHFRATWLRLAAMIGQNGRPVLLCGTVVPAELEPLPERVLFSAVHYLALMTDDACLEARLRARPAWRGWDDERIAEMLAFAGELRAEAATMEPPVELLETADRTASDLADVVRRWLLDRLP